MVTQSLRGKLHRRRCVIPLLAVFFPVLLSPLACNVDPVGLVTSSDLDTRLESRNVFAFLTDNDRNLSLGNEYSFIVLNDTHIENGVAHGFERLKDSIMPGDKFVVVTGDITQNGRREDLEKFIEIAGTLGIPCYPVIGNHDVYFKNWPVWRDLIGSTRYRINSDTTTLFILDSANAIFGSPQLDWLQEELAAAGGHVFVFTHTNLFVETPGDFQQFTDIRERARIISILKGRARAVFMGHVHKRIIRNAGGVSYISIEDFKRYKTYCRVYVSDAGIRYEFLNL
jgi:3',5'-cyclic AMP phosphodiesterase CpdA